MNESLFLLYLLTAGTNVLAPGPGVLMTIMKTLQRGYRGAVWVILGTASGTVIMALISSTGLGLLLSHSPQAYDVLRLIGAAYMVWLGVRNWRARPPALETVIEQKQRLDGKPADKPASDASYRWHFYFEGIGLQMTNPMLIMFFISLFPQFVDPALPHTFQLVVLTMTYFLLVVVLHTGYSMVTTYFRSLLSSANMARWIYRLGGSIFMLLAAWVVWQVINS